MSGRRRWATTPAKGRMVEHPTVVAAARIWDSHRNPRLTERSGVPIVSYCRTRVYLDRDAWEMLPPDGVLLMRVQPIDGPRFVLALTTDELEEVFGEVRATASWRDARCYHFPNEPPAAAAFVVSIDGTAATADRRTGEPATPAIRSAPRTPHVVRPAAPAAVGVAAPLREEPASFQEWAADWYARLGARPESAAYLQAVVAWRNAWRPERVRVLLLAESHVGEHPGDSRLDVMPMRWVGRSLPDRYVRLIYCLDTVRAASAPARRSPTAGLRSSGTSSVRSRSAGHRRGRANPRCSSGSAGRFTSSRSSAIAESGYRTPRRLGFISVAVNESITVTTCNSCAMGISATCGQRSLPMRPSSSGSSGDASPPRSRVFPGSIPGASSPSLRTETEPSTLKDSSDFAERRSEEGPAARPDDHPVAKAGARQQGPQGAKQSRGSTIPPLGPYVVSARDITLRAAMRIDVFSSAAGHPLLPFKRRFLVAVGLAVLASPSRRARRRCRCRVAQPWQLRTGSALPLAHPAAPARSPGADAQARRARVGPSSGRAIAAMVPARPEKSTSWGVRAPLTRDYGRRLRCAGLRCTAAR
jgi:hypothetical protein